MLVSSAVSRRPVERTVLGAGFFYEGKGTMAGFAWLSLPDSAAVFYDILCAGIAASRANGHYSKFLSSFSVSMVFCNLLEYHKQE